MASLLLDSFSFLLNSFVVCACFTKVQNNNKVVGFSWALLINSSWRWWAWWKCLCDWLGGEVVDANV